MFERDKQFPLKSAISLKHTGYEIQEARFTQDGIGAWEKTRTSLAKFFPSLAE